MMKKDKKYDEFSGLFAAHKAEVPDNGFSQRVMQTLPDRSYSSPLRYIVVALCALATLAWVFLTDDGFIVGAIADLVVAACTLSAPSPASLFAYVGLVLLLGTVGFAAYNES